MTAGARGPALLTGVTGGWGRAVLDRFVAAGSPVAVTHLPGEEPTLPDAVLGVEVDLTDPEAAERAVAACRDRLGAPLALVNVAGGFSAAGDVHDAPADVLRRQLELNVQTAYNMTRAVLPGMYEAGRGTIVYIGSAAADHPFPGAAGYIVSKAAVIALMRAVDAEARLRGVRANAIVPRVVDTPRNRAENPDADFSRWPTGAELAEVIHWLSSEASEPVSGAAVPVYGRS